MHGEALFTPVRIVSYIVLVAMLAALVYVAWISLMHLPGIGV